MAVAIGCDCDPDRPNFGGPTYQAERLRWDGIALGIEAFRRERKAFADATGWWPKVTWNVRADEQVARAHGDARYCVRTFRALWEALRLEGDEIAWHQHLWAWDSSRGEWFQKIGDRSFIEGCFENGFRQFSAEWGSPPRTVHAGWCYQDNDTLAALAALGITIDYSAVPGHNTLGRGTMDQADWSRAPTIPYYPSRVDYQMAGAHSAKQLSLLEIPASVGRDCVLSIGKQLREQIKRREFCWSGGLAYFVPLVTLHSRVCRPLFASALKRMSKPHRYILSYFHCDELLGDHAKSGLVNYLYGQRYLFQNVRWLAEHVGARPLTFVTVAELAQHMGYSGC